APPAPPGALILRTFVLADILTYSEELRLVSPSDGGWVWLAGLYYDWYQVHLKLNQEYAPDTASASALLSLLPGVGDSVTDRGVTLVYGELSPRPLIATERAAFGELTRKFGRHWEATIGG